MAYLLMEVVRSCSVLLLLCICLLLFTGCGYTDVVYTPTQFGYGGRLGGWSLGGGLYGFSGNCSFRPVGWGYYTTTASPVSTTIGPGDSQVYNCGFDPAESKTFGYWGYEVPAPPVGMSYPNVGWPYSMPYPYFTQPTYGPVGLPYYGVPVAYYNPYLFGFGRYDGIYGSARNPGYAIPTPKPRLTLNSPVYKGFRFGPGGQVVDYYKK
ncbi:uncharacterized protein LOC129601260 [Paramacrobiotus metropolitanus]|uniref:uncharacterized protein LOC129601260 n=1 Tax=Paramacrobiotus metropolitanus TaxID=2943436 RepID=UPI002446137B|nr:uncharacterized protein LOC129601260 [Paramacrobiotus metropolitanus]